MVVRKRQRRWEGLAVGKRVGLMGEGRGWDDVRWEGRRERGRGERGRGAAVGEPPVTHELVNTDLLMKSILEGRGNRRKISLIVCASPAQFSKYNGSCWEARSGSSLVPSRPNFFALQ